jgi:hypothetical protein
MRERAEEAGYEPREHAPDAGARARIASMRAQQAERREDGHERGGRDATEHGHVRDSFACP